MFQYPTVDMRHAEDDQGRFIEILTPGGIVRVNTNLVDTHSGSPVVVVEIEQNVYGRARTDTGGDWDVEVSEHLTGTRTDIRMLKR